MNYKWISSEFAIFANDLFRHWCNGNAIKPKLLYIYLNYNCVETEQNLKLVFSWLSGILSILSENFYILTILRKYYWEIYLVYISIYSKRRSFLIGLSCIYTILTFGHVIPAAIKILVFDRSVEKRNLMILSLKKF